jgi:nucleotide-binding universal stress UspA family protein
MPEIKKILFALELADISADIAPWANVMAEQFQAEIVLLHAVPDMVYAAMPYAVGTVMETDAMIASAKKKLSEFKDNHIKCSQPVTMLVVSGDPVVQILKHIENNDISMVIMGTHGRRGLSRAIFGSVADRVLRTSSVPVLCVNPTEEQEEFEADR